MPSKKILCPRQKFRKKTHVLPPKIPKHYAPARSSNEFSEFLAGAHVFFSEFLAGAKCFFGCHSQGSRQKVLFLRHSGPITGLDNQTQPRRPITGLEKCLEREKFWTDIQCRPITGLESANQTGFIDGEMSNLSHMSIGHWWIYRGIN